MELSTEATVSINVNTHNNSMNKQSLREMFTTVLIYQDRILTMQLIRKSNANADKTVAWRLLF